MRTLTMLMRPFRRSIANRIVMQLIAIACLFLLICLHLQYEFANRPSSSMSSSKSSRRPTRGRKNDRRFPTDDDNFFLYGGLNDGVGLRTKRKDEEDIDDDMGFLYIDINDEQKNNVRSLDQGGGADNTALEAAPHPGRGASGGSGGNVAGAMGQYQVGRKALLSKRISSVGEEYPAAPAAPAESTERSYAGLPLEPWAARDHSMDAEVGRFFKYITTIQVQCREQRAVGSGNPAETGSNWPWMVCFDSDPSYASRGALRPGCVVYSFGARSNNIRFETEMADRGCEVHIFDPSGRVRAQVTEIGGGGDAGKTRLHQQKREQPQQRQKARRGSGSSGGGGGGKPGAMPRNVIFHRMTLDWRDSNVNTGNALAWRPKKLSAIMSMLGHDTVDIVRADLQSAEWKVLESLLLDGTVARVHQLLFNVHLNWSGFEVQGDDDADVVRFWYSVLHQLEHARFGLFHSWADRTEPTVFLGQTRPDIRSTYALGWVNNAWR